MLSRTIFAALVVLGAACGSTPKPLPGGPPPEYETPRGYDGGIGETPSPAPPSEPAPQPAEPLPAAPKPAAPDAGTP